MPQWREAARCDEVDADAWDALAADAGEPNPFLERFALAPFARLGAGPLRLVCVWEGPDLLGLAALTTARGYARLPIRHAASWRHPHLFDATPLVRRGAEAAFARGLLAWLDQAAGVRFAHLSRMRHGAVACAVQAEAARTGRASAVVEVSARPYLPLARYGCYERYLAEAVGSATRKSVRRVRRRLDARGAVTVAALGPGEDARPWLDAFADAEHGGWKGAAGTSLRAKPGEHAAFAAMARAAHARGRLAAHQLRVGGRPVAHALDLRAGGGAFALKAAYDEAWAAHAPGVALDAALIERGIAKAHACGPAWIDSCAAQNHDVLGRLWPETRPLLQLLVARRGVANGSAYRLARGLERAGELRRKT